MLSLLCAAVWTSQVERWNLPASNYRRWKGRLWASRK